MPRYYFHLYNDITTLDEEGVQFPGLQAARANAITEARELMMEAVAEGRINFSHRIDIADENDTVIATVSFREAVAVVG